MDTFNFRHFLEAQAPVYDTVLSELLAGHKRSHWMWFIFPQLAGLGQSAMSQRFALRSVEHARAYLQHEVLGMRLFECAALVEAIPGRSVGEIFDAPDDMKFHSCMTLFALAAPDQEVFAECLRKYFAGLPDKATLSLLSNSKEKNA
jgi:uncharacterized protein (DUF1810 family)